MKILKFKKKDQILFNRSLIKKKTRRFQPERNLQIRCVCYFKEKYPDRMIIANPNGGKRNVFEAMRMKQMGVLSGVYDLFIPEPVYPFHGLWVEMKYGKGNLSDNQKEFKDKISARGYAAVECWNEKEFEKILTEYFSKHAFQELQIVPLA